jgi:hypothetical protein
VHLELIGNVTYLAAVAEDTVFDDEVCAKRIATRISDFKKQYELPTALSNAVDLVGYLNMVRENNTSITASYLNSSSYADLTDITAADRAITKLRQKSGPWIDASLRFPIDSTCNGIIIKRSDRFGLLVEIEKDVAGILHKSKLPLDYLSDDLFLVGKSIVVKILYFDPINMKLHLECAQNSL